MNNDLKNPLPNPPLIREGSKAPDSASSPSPDKGRSGGVSSCAALPSGWIETTLGEINHHKSRNIIPSDFPNELFELYSVPIFSMGKPEYVKGNEIGSSKQEVFPDDVLLCKINPRINRVWCVAGKQKNRQIASSEWIVIRNERILSDYLRYALTRKEFRDVLCSEVAGVGGSLTRAQPKKVATYKIPLAPANEQLRIANKLDSLLAKVETAQTRLENIPALLKRFRQAVLAAATSGELTREWREENSLNGSWRQLTLSDVAETLDPNPSHRYPEPDSEGVPILSTQQFVGLSGWTTEKAKLVCGNFYLERRDKCGFFDADIIFARKGRLGLARYAPSNMEYVLSHTVFIVRAKKGVLSDYLLWFLRSESVVEWLLMTMNSNTGVPTLGKAVFEKLPVKLPSVDEQAEIVRRVESLFAMADTVERQYQAAKARLDKLTQAILAKAFRGELVPQDPDDEPASVLLQRINAEKHNKYL
ncbi:MAG: restriction endonuclease subunit S [Candidatus Thiothrix moscowensis]|nr:restriction endonuclease subunit S [Candidatus Thiothrix moscowensis]